MRYHLIKWTILSVLASAWQAHGSDATWTGAVSSDLTSTAGNWTPSGVPTGIATFNSALPPITFSPTAASQFIIDTINFSNSASVFQFTFTDAALLFSGSGITGTFTNTTFTFTNAAMLGTPQLFPYTIDASAVSFGTANFSFTNSAAGMI